MQNRICKAISTIVMTAVLVLGILFMLIGYELYSKEARDTLMSSADTALSFTDKPEEMALTIISKLGRGVTSIPATGMYTRETHSMLVCVINRRQIATFRKILKDVDPDSFAVMSGVSQVLGLGFFSGED